MKQILSPTLQDLREEYVLMQAWKKTSCYLRNHSWYADTLEIDFQSLRVPAFIQDLQEQLASPQTWSPSLLDLVPAPKSQLWILNGDNWKPKPGINPRQKIRPLAHVSLEDQVVATAILMCLADRVESRLGNPLLDIEKPDKRRRTLAYGHRLFCDSEGDRLRHRWGSSKLFRLYFRDYQTFLRRPEIVAESLSEDGALSDEHEIAIVQSDLSKFYDRVRPSLLHSKLESLLPSEEDASFMAFCRRVFDWRWKDESRAMEYARLGDKPIMDFSTIALPQGLVASGFFANIVLCDFENRLREAIDQAIDENHDLILKDVCYYVDDLRLVFVVKGRLEEKEIESRAQQWLQALLDETAQGLIVEESKTKATVKGRQQRFLVPQSQTAKRIQNDVSGVFDMTHGTELIGAIEGFFHTQKRYSSNTEEPPLGRSGLLVGLSDMRDDTAARFAAGRFRRTFRSLRPLLFDEERDDRRERNNDNESEGDDSDPSPSRLVLSREQLDERGKLFSAMLIEEWVGNPGNVRLLRIALDLYPDRQFLGKVLKILRPGWGQENSARGARREVLQYCLAELFRAGATETGQVPDDDCLPTAIDLDIYHQRLSEEGRELLTACMATRGGKRRFPWYLIQQVFLYLAVRNELPREFILGPIRKSRGLNRHQQFARFIHGDSRPPLPDRAAYLILAQSSFGLLGILDRVIARNVSPQFLQSIGEISPEIATSVWSLLQPSPTDGQATAARSLGIVPVSFGSESLLADFVLRRLNPFWEEENLLRLAIELLEVPDDRWPDVVTPWQIRCEISPPDNSLFGKLKPQSVNLTGALPKAVYLFSVPAWCDTAEDKRRFQVGMILRFALRGSVDFYGSARQQSNSQRPRYRQPVSHWERQRYSSFQGRSAFGPPWIPLSSWTEDFLFDLLRWPGSGLNSQPVPLEEWKLQLRERLNYLSKARGEATGLIFLEQAAPWPDKSPVQWQRPLRVGIVQSVIPDMCDYGRYRHDPELLDPTFRIRHRRHFSALLEGVVQMLQVRETHKRQERNDGRILDILVFPELAIHPFDIHPLILPFIRTHKCIVLFGQVYHPANTEQGAQLINSCLWAIPEWGPTSGFQVRFVEQGKEHLAEPERNLQPAPVSFRPAQWIINYRWTSDTSQKPLRLSASICYDATDLSLATDLKSRNDLYFVCALNRDVGTFDRMSEGLHYHMYQGVLIVNNGQFGGSSFYIPFSQTFHRQVFHLHGQPQASIAFAEVSPEKLINRPNNSIQGEPDGKWKTPPANWHLPH